MENVFAGTGGSLIDLLDAGDAGDGSDLDGTTPDSEWGEIARELALLRLGGERYNTPTLYLLCLYTHQSHCGPRGLQCGAVMTVHTQLDLHFTYLHLW